MRFNPSFYAILLGLAVTAQGSSNHASGSKREATVFNAKNATLAEFNSHAHEVALSRIGNSTACSRDNVRVRKLFENLTNDERISYTDALKCLMDLPAKTPSSLAPGAKSRYDDWVVTHINQTLTIHLNANFLGWHRWYIWEMEQALRSDCGYKGPFPYCTSIPHPKQVLWDSPVSPF
jgi:tyrosinase